jgi:hypothetical protein
MNAVTVFFRTFRALFFGVAFLLVLHTLLRICFIGYNPQPPSPVTGGAALILGWGVVMDLSALILLNIPVFLLFWASQYATDRARELLLGCTRVCYIVLNAAGVAVNIIDIGYFRYNHHRSNIDLWYVLGDSASSFGSVAARWWPLIGLFLVLVAGLVWIGRKIFKFSPLPGRFTLAVMQATLAVFLIAGARGLTARPLLPTSPLLDIDPAQLPKAQNSIETLLYSLLRRHKALKPVHYFTQEELDKIAGTHFFLGGVDSMRDTTAEGSVQTGRRSAAAGPFEKKNVVICILESFSRCYLEPGNPMKAITPFFDSLTRKSILFPQAYANGYSSNQGIVAILGGLPAFLDEPFYYSEYANTPLRSIGNILKEEGYNTNFFLGAGKDHFGFGKFTHMAGIDHYYGRADFEEDPSSRNDAYPQAHSGGDSHAGGDRSYDGNWGIFDEPFLQYGARVLAEKPAPFLAVFFNISSHPPFTIPDLYRDRFNFPGKTPAQRSISYVDYSFRHFFAACEKEPWFRNTLFVFCADHWFDPADGKGAYNYINISSIPIFIFDPSRDSGRVNNTLASQVDLTPTILGYLHYKGSYTGFGKDLLDSTAANNYSVSRMGDLYQVITEDYVLGYDLSQDKNRYLYRHHGDSMQGKNLLEDGGSRDERSRLEKIIRANIQCYNQALIKRSLE